MTMPVRQFRPASTPPSRRLHVSLWIASVTVVTVVAGLAGEARARPASQVKVEDVIQILRSKSRPTPADLAVAGADVDRVLVDLLVARKVEPDVRFRAAKALSGYPGQRARAVLASMIPNHEEPSSLRAAMMISLALVAREKAVDDLLPWFKDADPVLRAGAGRALGETGDVRACSLLESALEHEEVLEVRKAIEDGTKACAKRRKP
jgi:HEAT repeat protein